MFFAGIDWLVFSSIIFVGAVITAVSSYFCRQFLEITLENVIDKMRSESNVNLLQIKKNSADRVSEMHRLLTGCQKSALLVSFFSGVLAAVSKILSCAAFLGAHWEKAIVISGVVIYVAYIALKAYRVKRAKTRAKTVQDYASEVADNIRSHAPKTETLRMGNTTVIRTTPQNRVQVVPAENSDYRTNHQIINEHNDPYAGLTRDEFDRFVNETYH